VLQNGEVREQLNQTKSRHQDIILHVHDALRRYASHGEAPTAEDCVKCFFKTKPPTAKIMAGYILIANNVSTHVLKKMVALPFEVPAWFFKCLAAEFLKLSGMWELAVYPPTPLF
jgi:hypothetical protein